MRVCVQTWLTPEKHKPRFDWATFDKIEFSDQNADPVSDVDRAFIAKWRKPVRQPALPHHHIFLNNAVLILHLLGTMNDKF